MIHGIAAKVRKTWSAGGFRAVLKQVGGRLIHEARRIRNRGQRRTLEYQRVYEAGGWSSVFALLRRQTKHQALRSVGLAQSEEELIRVSMEYWNEGDRAGIDLKDYSHWLGAGPWQDRERWLKLGRVHFRMYERLTLVASTPRPLKRAVEWGCGGGANAIHFVNEVEEFYGIEIAQPSLDECARVLAAAGFRGFRPVLISAESPEQALELAGGQFDFFLSAYVFELIPGKQYGKRVLRVAYDLLRPGGLALIQIRYDDGSERSTQKHLDYYKNSSRFTSYRVEEFWVIAEQIGFLPEYVTLVPEKTEEFSGDLYAYFALVKPQRATA